MGNPFAAKLGLNQGGGEPQASPPKEAPIPATVDLPQTMTITTPELKQDSVLATMAASPTTAPPTKLGNMFAKVRENQAAQPVTATPTAAAPPIVESISDSTDDDEDIDLDALADMVADDSAPLKPASSFADETPATAPLRELPADWPEETHKQMLQFVDLIDGVYQVLDDPELTGNVIRSIMVELKDNPQYMKMVAPEDIHVWVRAMRDSMGLARIKKQETSAKRKTGTTAGPKGKKEDAELAAAMSELGFSAADFD